MEINRIPIKNAITFFFAGSLNEAKNQAIDMDLKDFAVVSDSVYIKGVDY